MDMLDPALEGGQDKGAESNASEDGVHLVQDGDLDDTADEQASAIAGVAPATIHLDPSGQVTYRVVQVAPSDGGEPHQVITQNPFHSATAGGHVAQAVIQSPFSNGGSPTPETLGGAETRFTYVPATVGGDGIATADGTNIAQVATAGGQFYVMMSPQDVLDSQRQLAPRTPQLMTSPQVTPSKSGGSRDGRRRATHNEGQFYVMMSPQEVLDVQRQIAPKTGLASIQASTFKPCAREGRRKVLHNEVERRRRDKINNWIVQLSKLIPDCAGDHTKQGQSKGGILAKACEYIQGLRTANARMADSLKDMEKLSVDVELLRQQCEELKQENVVLRTQLQQHGIVPQDVSSSANS